MKRLGAILASRWCGRLDNGILLQAFSSASASDQEQLSTKHSGSQEAPSQAQVQTQQRIETNQLPTTEKVFGDGAVRDSKARPPRPKIDLGRGSQTN
ncbi:hypothetical protein Dimus_039568 [Dionaea muscipula]